MSVEKVERTGRPNQRSRTRKDLLHAASRLIKEGRKPSLDEVAEEALVSRATAYRYFPSVEALLLEASLDVAVPEPGSLFRDAKSDDPVERMNLVEAVLHDMIRANEAPIRLMLANSLTRIVEDAGNGKVPARQNRRMPLIEAALTPARAQFKPAALKTLNKALAMVVGTESMIVCKDVLQLDEADARKVRRWAIRALIEAAKK